MTGIGDKGMKQSINVMLLRFFCVLCFAGHLTLAQAEDDTYEEDTILKEADAFLVEAQKGLLML